ncbi:hypothetical protein Pen01_02030 [Phytomonospora endophytica]|nr:hypothetical protein Pen01_02030 [Phytomonospora endophytica]
MKPRLSPLSKVPKESVSDAVEAVSADALLVSGRSPMSWAVTTGASKLSTTGGLSTRGGSDHSPPTPGASLLSEVGGGWAAPGPGTASANEVVEGVELVLA